MYTPKPIPPPVRVFETVLAAALLVVLALLLKELWVDVVESATSAITDPLLEVVR